MHGQRSSGQRRRQVMAEAEGSNPITRFCNMLTQVNITEIDEDDPHYVLYAVRVPAEARLDHDALVALFIGMSEREEYLGDGLYASFDGYQIRLGRRAGSASIMKSFANFLGFIDALPK